MVELGRRTRTLAPRRAVTSAAALLLFILTAAGVRAPLTLFYELRLASASEDAWAPAAKGILRFGNEVAHARLARLMIEAPEEKRRRVWFGVVLEPGARVLIPHLLRAAAQVETDEQREWPLHLAGTIASYTHEGDIHIHENGTLFWRSLKQKKATWRCGCDTRAALRAWTRWLVEHGYVAPDDPVVAAVGSPPPADTDPPPLGAHFDEEPLAVASVDPDGPAARLGVRAGDRIGRIWKLGAGGLYGLYPDRCEGGEPDWLTWAREDPRCDEVLIELSGRVIDWRIPPRGATEQSVGATLRQRVVAEIVIPGLPLARAGVRDGDVLRSVDGHAVRSVAELRGRLVGKRSAELVVGRSGSRIALALRLEP